MDTSEGALPFPQPWRKADGSVNPAGDPAGRAVTAEVDGTNGLLLPVRQSTTAALVVLGVVGVGLLVLAGFLFTGGVLSVISGVVVLLLGALVVISCLAALGKPRRAVGLLLTPEALVLNWATPRVSVPWSQVRELRPVAVRMGRANTSTSVNYLGVATVDPAGAGQRHHVLAERFGKDLAFALSMRTLLVDQMVVLRALRHYLDNPGDRAELGTPAAIARVHG